MASMRYVRDGSNRAQTHPNVTHETGKSNGKTRMCYEQTSHGGRFFLGRGRGRGRINSHSFVRSATTSKHRGEKIMRNKWVRTSDDALLEESAKVDSGVSDELCPGVGSAVSGNPGSEVAGSIDHATIESEFDHRAERNDLSTSMNFEKRGKHKLVLKKEDSTNINSNDHDRENEELDAATHHAKMAFASAHKAVNDQSNSMLIKKLGKNKLVLQKDDSVSLEGNNADNKKHNQIGPFHVATNEKMEQGSNATVVSTHNEAEEGTDLCNKPNIIDRNTLPTRSKSSFTWSRESTTQRIGLASSTDSKKCYDNARFARKRKPPFTQYDAASKGSRRICLNTTLPTTETSACVLPSDEYNIETEKSMTATPLVNSTAKNLTDFCYRDTGRGKVGVSTGGGRHITRGRSARKGNIGLVRVKPENLSATAICPTFRRGLPCNNPTCTLRHDVSSEASRPICVFFQRHGMCSKGDQCAFRHVKVRWDAEVCPMFEKWGYCEDPGCVLRHVVARKAAEGKDGLTSKSFSQH